MNPQIQPRGLHFLPRGPSSERALIEGRVVLEDLRQDEICLVL